MDCDEATYADLGLLLLLPIIQGENLSSLCLFLQVKKRHLGRSNSAIFLILAPFSICQAKDFLGEDPFMEASFSFQKN